MLLKPDTPDRFVRAVQLAAIVPFLVGGLCGTGVFVWTHQYLATFGVSLPASAGLATALSLSAWLSAWGWQQLSAANLERALRPAAWLVIALWTLSFPWLLAAARWTISIIPLGWLEVEALAFVILATLSTALFLLPISACFWLGSRRPESAPRAGMNGLPWSARYLCGCGLALGTAPVLWATWLPVERIGLMVIGLAVMGCWGSLLWGTESPPMKQGRVFENQTLAAADRPTIAWMAGVSLLVGLHVPLTERTIMQFLPGVSAAHFAGWSGFVCGVACGAAWSSKLVRRRETILSHGGLLFASLMTALWPVALLLFSPVLLYSSLSINAYISSVWLLTAVRWTLPFLAVVPLGVAAGRAWTHGGAPTAVLGGSIGPACLAIGLCLMDSLWVPQTYALPLLVFASVLLAAVRLWGQYRIVFHWKLGACGAAAAVLLGSLPLAEHFDRPDLAARLLFSTQSFAAYNAGIDRDLLAHVDDGRLVALRDGREAVWTVWKHRGSQFLFRRNGIPVGIVSTHPEICPQFAGDVVPAVVPLVVHPHPDNVLLVGLGSTATLTTCLACPVRHITCLEGDRDLVRIADEFVGPTSGFNPLSDDRVQLRIVDPTLALLANGERYDVVILRDSQPFLSSQSPRFTREFYERVHAHLNAGGIVCQSLQYADFGRRPIEDALATLRSVFPQVACLESAPGEMLLLCSKTEASIFDESLLKRCEADHVRRLLAQLGWDWSVILNLTAIAPSQVNALVAQRNVANTIANGKFAYRLPQEVMRWGPKWQEIQQLLAERGSRMLAWVGESADVQDVGHRLADMTEQQRLIVEHPDRYWAYRAVLKERLTDRPRSQIVPVHHEIQRVLHPEDERRKEYLEALGDAATSSAPPAGDVARLSEFTEPYDPLVSYFLHGEAARLYERTTGDHRADQFHHLRYSVHFGPQQDRSLRNVVTALKLLVDAPELIADPAERFDEMNSLLDILRQRALLRVQTDRTASPFELVDAEQSIHVAERAMQLMDDLHGEAAMSSRDWQHRRTVLQRMLVRPMWTYHAQQAQRLATLEAREHQTAEVESEPAQTR